MTFSRPLMMCMIFLCALVLCGLAHSVQGADDDPASAKAQSVKVAAATGADLRPFFERWGLPPRSQGKRGTCSVFTMVGALEYAKATHEGKGSRLSVEYLSWAKNKVPSVKIRDGGKFSDLWAGFLADGICLEKDMPYQPKYDRNRVPSPEAQAYGKKLERGDFHIHWIKPWNVKKGITEKQFEEIKQVLRSGWPVCGGFRWPRSEEWQENQLQMLPPEGVYDGHSVLLVGYRDDAKLPGGGAFILRDSLCGRDGGLMCYAYARDYMNDALWIEAAKAPADPKGGMKGER
jgi:C1A family cysteine protease